MASSDSHFVSVKTPGNGRTSPAFGTADGSSLNPPQRLSLDRDASGTKFIVVMGVSGTGKSTLGAALSKALHLPFVDGDDLHPAANVAKMSRGEPLNDADRQPWLDAIRNTAIACVRDQLGVDHGERVEPTKHEEDGDEERRLGVIVACSSLKRAYRAVLRGEGVPPSLQTQAQMPRSGPTSNAPSLPTYFVYLKGDRDVLMARMQNREGHFMKAGMLESQLDTLESPENESGVVSVSVAMSTGEQVRRVLEMFRSQEGMGSS